MTRCGSREFQASSAARTFWIADSRVNGGAMTAAGVGVRIVVMGGLRGSLGMRGDACPGHTRSGHERECGAGSISSRRRFRSSALGKSRSVSARPVEVVGEDVEAPRSPRPRRSPPSSNPARADLIEVLRRSTRPRVSTTLRANRIKASAFGSTAVPEPAVADLVGGQPDHPADGRVRGEAVVALVHLRDRQGDLLAGLGRQLPLASAPLSCR